MYYSPYLYKHTLHSENILYTAEYIREAGPAATLFTIATA